MEVAGEPAEEHVVEEGMKLSPGDGGKGTQVEEDGEEDIDDAALEDEETPVKNLPPKKARGSQGRVSAAVLSEADDQADLDEDEKAIAGMPEEERARLKDVVWAKLLKFPHYPAVIYHPADVAEGLRKKLFSGKVGPATHHIVFFYNYGANAFSAVPFKNILPWTPEDTQTFRKAVARDKKIDKAIEQAEADLLKPKDDRNPGPPDKRRLRRLAKQKEREEKGVKSKTPHKKRKSSNAARRSSQVSQQEEDDDEDDDDEEEDETGSEDGVVRKRRSRGPGGPIPNKKERAVSKVKSWWSKHARSFPGLGAGGEGEGSGKKRRRPDSTGGGGKGDKALSAKKKKKKEKKDYDQETPEERFERLLKNVAILLDSKTGLDVDKLCITLGKLSTIKGLDLNWTPLRQAIAKVKELRGHSDKRVQLKATEVYQHWKKALRSPSAPAGEGGAASEKKAPAADVKPAAAESSTKSAQKRPREEETKDKETKHIREKSPPRKKERKGEETCEPASDSVLPSLAPAGDDGISAAPMAVDNREEQQQQPPQHGADDHKEDASNEDEKSAEARTNTSPVPDDDENKALGGVANPRPFPSPRESQTRSRARNMIATVLGEHEDVAKAAETIEEVVFEQHNQSVDDKHYLVCLRSLCFQIKTYPEVRDRIAKGDPQAVKEAMLPRSNK